jgi:glutamate/tyrosine decarboxylase-like PLP-dependent enzyme
MDPLASIADVCAEEDLWFHVDAAYGGPSAFTDDLRPLFTGIERADSIAFDPHKWLYTPLTGGCVLVRDMQELPDSFSVTASYTYQDKERTGQGIDGNQLGPQFSRGFWAFKIWLSLLAHGRAAYARRISHERRRPVPHAERGDFELSARGAFDLLLRYVPDLPDEGQDRHRPAERTADDQVSRTGGCSLQRHPRGRFVLRAAS